ncbi:MAG TPA: DAK2 domain-containing protein [Acholeplasma sp.]|nr:DAK2 domain-containing protein [Acholeplasma sp.]
MSETKILTGQLFKQIVSSGAKNLKANYKKIDELNVFPVPDGDTGINMLMTIESGVKEMNTYAGNDLNVMMQKLSRGMLIGARGNSGVILSQIFRGLSNGIGAAKEADAVLLASAYQESVKQAYKAVMTPVEGTILTVARLAADRVSKVATKEMTIEEFYQEYLNEAKIALEDTPNLLPVLKEAGVVDSGGAGYVTINEGIVADLSGATDVVVNLDEALAATASIDLSFGNDDHDHENEFGYCTEFLLQLAEKNKNSVDERTILNEISPLGDSIVCVKDGDIIKVHIHTLTPGVILNIGQRYGEFIQLKIENMTLQHNEIHHKEPKQKEEPKVEVKKDVKKEKYAIVTVATGEGLINTFKELGADYVIHGGQSMNPSTADFLNAYGAVNAENIIVFPNNSNIVLTAKQSAELYEDAKIWVLETKSIAQGFSAITMVDLEQEPEVLLNNLKKVIVNVTTGQVTYSIRDADNNGIKIKKDDYIAICNGKIVASHKNRYETTKRLLKESITPDKEIITIIRGKDADQREINNVVKHITKNYQNVEVDVVEGDQEVYSYILAIE